MSLLEGGNCCDLYCTTCKIWYLRLLRPGDNVPFVLSPKTLPLGITQCGLGMFVIVLDILMLFCQYNGTAAPSPSLLGSPATPLWVSIVFVGAGVSTVVAYKKKGRFMTAIGFACSILSVLFSVCLIAISMMGMAQEVEYFEEEKSSAGVIVGSVLLLTVVAEVVISASNTLICYLALSSHDDRWFTDRGTQYLMDETPSESCPTAKVSVPSGQPAFLFYAPSSEAAKYSSALRDMLSTSIPNLDDKESPKRSGVRSPQLGPVDSTIPPQHANKTLPGNYLSPPVNQNL